MQKLMSVMLFCLCENFVTSLVPVSSGKAGLMLYSSVSNTMRTKKDIAVCLLEQNCISEVGVCLFCLPVLIMQLLTQPENYFAHGCLYPQFMLYLFVTVREYQSFWSNVSSAKILSFSNLKTIIQ